jgi:hypothetical protein
MNALNGHFEAIGGEESTSEFIRLARLWGIHINKIGISASALPGRAFMSIETRRYFGRRKTSLEVSCQ